MPLAVHHLVPMDSETRWSDLLASCIETDPTCVAALLNLGDGSGRVEVRRESPAGGRGRIDLLVSVDGQRRCLIEVKVLAGLGTAQLSRYGEAFPDVAQRVLVFPGRLPLDLGTATGWTGITWEEMLTAFEKSTNPWVATTARAWLDHLRDALPAVDGRTRWNDLEMGSNFIIGMRTRMAWVFQQLSPPDPIYADLVGSASGVGWVARMQMETVVDGHLVRIEAEENLPNQSYPKIVGPTTPAPRGPSVKVCLVQRGVRSSVNFDWRYLLAVWPLMEEVRTDWVRTAARPKAVHDRAGHRQMVDAGGPPFLGIGFGDAQAARSGECMFGARFQLPPDVTLATVVETLNGSVDLMRAMAKVPAPSGQ